MQAAHHALQAREQLPGIERLRDVVVRAYFQADDAVHDAVRGRHHDDSHVVALAQVARQGEPVLARELDVEQHHVRQVALDHFAHVAAAFRLVDLIALPAEVLRDHLPHVAVVLDDEHAAVAGH